MYYHKYSRFPTTKFDNKWFKNKNLGAEDLFVQYSTAGSCYYYCTPFDPANAFIIDINA